MIWEAAFTGGSVLLSVSAAKKGLVEMARALASECRQRRRRLLLKNRCARLLFAVLPGEPTAFGTP
ncbi:MAG TPA: hypothetical protein VKG22_07380 [Stellaceae bacterium]|nr:hypothetical protein [Stellaceae bacterium]HMD66454.1 hypothetical protein [Stellaceae bacterium]